MSRTIRYQDGKRFASRAHMMHHRFEGHKMAAQVNQAYAHRFSHAPAIERTGIRGK